MKKFVRVCGALCVLALPFAAISGTIAKYMGNATHEAYLGVCDAGRVVITAYKGDGYKQMDVFVIDRGRQTDTLYAVEIDDNNAEFIIDTPAGERPIDQAHSLGGLSIIAPNTFAMLRNRMNADAQGTVQIPNDCVLSDADTKGEWRSLSK